MLSAHFHFSCHDTYVQTYVEVMYVYAKILINFNMLFTPLDVLSVASTTISTSNVGFMGKKMK